MHQRDSLNRYTVTSGLRFDYLTILRFNMAKSFVICLLLGLPQQPAARSPRSATSPKKICSISSGLETRKFRRTDRTWRLCA